MNKAAIEKYAPAARKAFIAAVTRRAELLGLDPDAPPSIEHDGDVMVINGQAFSAEIESQRDALEQRIAREGFDAVMDAMAYTWFNRLVAIRYMELHGYLGHGYRVLSHPDASDGQHNQPEILDHLTDVELPGLNKAHALDLKLAGNRDEDLYREVLLAQCHALHTAMPFLFEPIDDATELLLPEGLLRTDSLIHKLVTAIDEADWQDVEIIGWLYQFYISEKKDQVIGKVVKSEDIPAATQLFTPNWIVKYLVQNSLGRLWIMANPTSQLATKWEYYIQPAEQTPEVNAQLDALIQARIDEDGASLNPESLTLLDPACGSGHILVEAFDLLRDIYLERGYRKQDIPRLILEKNLYGLDIDDRAAQLAGFALLMKARADDRRLFGQPVELNVLALQEAKEGSAEELHSALNAPQIDSTTVSQLVQTFEQAKTFGSLIQIPDELASASPDLRRELETVRNGGDMLGRDAAEILLRLVAQVEVLAMQFDAVVANPPYMGNRAGMNAELKDYARRKMDVAKGDTFSMFMYRALSMIRPTGRSAMVTLDSWLTLTTYKDFREEIFSRFDLCGLAHMPYEGKKPTAMGINFGVVCSVLAPGKKNANQTGYFVRQRFTDLNSTGAPASLQNFSTAGRHRRSTDFLDVPNFAVVYNLSDAGLSTLKTSKTLGTFAEAREGMATADNDRFLRWWFEVPIDEIAFGCNSNAEAKARDLKWFPYVKGGDYQKWHGNLGLIVDWKSDGAAIRNNIDSSTGRVRSHNYNGDYAFRPGLTWTSMSSKGTAARLVEPGFMFDAKGPMLFGPESTVIQAAALINCKVGVFFLNALSGTKDFKIGQMMSLPILDSAAIVDQLTPLVRRLVKLSSGSEAINQESWAFETSALRNQEQLAVAAEAFVERQRVDFEAAKALETEINETLIAHYSLEGELDAEVSDEEITLPLWDCKELAVREVAYMVGCMMGRYSLDAPGLIYAHAGNEGFDPSRYGTFPADDDGIVPITDEAWFDDDGANRIREFVRVVWGEDTEAENMAWLAESMGQKVSESADDTIRRYLSRDFYKDHLQTYKKRPIYWLFSSGKHQAFEALVYLHRYNAGTLSRMRMQYVVPLQSKMQIRIGRLDEDVQSSSSSAEQKRLQKQRDKLAKQLDELRRFDEELRHYADQRISLDLDDGVKENYKKFGTLLAERKSVTGEK